METSAVRRQVRAAIDRAKSQAAERRERTDRAEREYPAFLATIVVPLFRQVAGSLKAEGYPFSVFTPSGSVRLMSDRSADDFIEVSLDTSGDEPAVVGHVKRGRGRRVIESEHRIGSGPIAGLTEEQVLDFLTNELAPFVER